MADEELLNEEADEPTTEEVKFFSSNNINYLLQELVKRLNEEHIEE